MKYEWNMVTGNGRDALEIERVCNMMGAKGWVFGFMLNDGWLYFHRPVQEQFSSDLARPV